MANYTVPSQHGVQIPLQTQDRDFLSALDVVWANKYEEETIDPTNAIEMEFEFYRGAPPQWLNFFWADKQKSPFVKRDMYQILQEKINENKTKRRSIVNIHLFHEPGSGGSTLAMQLLWDLRKELRCAKVLDSTTDTKAIAQQVLRLFRAGGSGKQNTVLLLLDNKYTGEDTSFKASLEENLFEEIKTNNITARIPVVIILNCLRQTDLTEKAENKISSSLSQTEQCHFEKKGSEIIQIHGDRHTQLHAFNIMMSNYNQDYVKKVCEILQPLKKKWRPRKQQLLAFLALINSYVPGSALSYDLCQTFIRREGNNLEDFSFKLHMQPFTDFLVSTKEEQAGNENKCVRMAHPMVAQECLRLLTKAGVTRSDITLQLLRELCRNDMSVFLVKTIKKLLTKREYRLQDSRVTLDTFSKLILDIKEKENKSMGVAVLKMALKKFETDPFYPQALARFYYIEKNDYVRAEHWAKNAIARDETNSFIRDTLGQVHKNWLKNLAKPKKQELALIHARKVLQHGKQATEAFTAEEEAAREEEAPEMQEHGITSTSNIFNNRGIFGYMQVAKSIFYHLTTLYDEWSKVLTKERTTHHLVNYYGSGKFEKHKGLIRSLRDEVEDKFQFFEWYLLYSKPSIHKDEPTYFWEDVDECYRKFVTQDEGHKSPLQDLKEGQVSTFAGLLSNLTREVEMQLITEQWKEIYLASPSDVKNIENYIVANIMLSHTKDSFSEPLEKLQEMLHNLWAEQKENRSPEFYLLVLLLFWPDAHLNRPSSVNISECVRYMRNSFNEMYKKYLRSRYLMPLFFLTEGQGLQRFIPTSCLDKTSIDLLIKGNERVEIPQLKRARGQLLNNRVFAVEGLEVHPDNPASVCGPGNVSFYLAFNIKGPVAYRIRYEQ